MCLKEFGTACDQLVLLLLFPSPTEGDGIGLPIRCMYSVLQTKQTAVPFE